MPCNPSLRSALALSGCRCHAACVLLLSAACARPPGLSRLRSAGCALRAEAASGACALPPVLCCLHSAACALLPAPGRLRSVALRSVACALSPALCRFHSAASVALCRLGCALCACRQPRKSVVACRRRPSRRVLWATRRLRRHPAPPHRPSVWSRSLALARRASARRRSSRALSTRSVPQRRTGVAQISRESWPTRDAPALCRLRPATCPMPPAPCRARPPALYRSLPPCRLRPDVCALPPARCRLRDAACARLPSRRLRRRPAPPPRRPSFWLCPPAFTRHASARRRASRALRPRRAPFRRRLAEKCESSCGGMLSAACFRRALCAAPLLIVCARSTLSPHVRDLMYI